MKLALIQILGEHEGPVDPGYGRPGFGGPVDPGYGRPIFHPGHPDHGLPAAPAHPDQSLPWTPGHPDNNLPIPPGIDRPETPPSLKNKLIVLWRMPNTVEWHGKVMDPSHRPDHELPPAPTPKY